MPKIILISEKAKKEHEKFLKELKNIEKQINACSCNTNEPCLKCQCLILGRKRLKVIKGEGNE